MPGPIDTLTDRLTSDEGNTIDITDTGDLVDFVQTGGLREETNTGTPPPIGPGGSAIAGLGLRSRLAGAAGFEALRSDTGQDAVGYATDPDNNPNQDDPPGVLRWLIDNSRTVLIGVVVLGVLSVIGNLFTFEVGA